MLACLVAAGALLAPGIGPSTAAAQLREPLVVRQLDFQGNDAIPDETIASAIATTNSSWFARAFLIRELGLGERRYFNELEFARDVLRVQILYRRSGYPDVQVDTTVRRTESDAYVTFEITEGEPTLIDSIGIEGVDSLPADARRNLLLDLPLAAGDVFNRYLMQNLADSLVRRLRDRGYPATEVFIAFEERAGERRAVVNYDVYPGERAVFGDVRIEGIDRVDTAVVADLLAARSGQEFSQSDLFESQRNLYSSDLFRLATVGIDSAAWEPGVDSVPLVARVAESRKYRLRTGFGYGTNDCFRASAGFTVRNFVSRGRIFDVTTRVSKVGVGRPTDWGLENGICGPLADDSIGSRLLNYGVNVAIRRPAFLSPNNTITYSAFAERRSEFQAYLREDIGVSATVTRQTPNRRLPLGVAYTLSFGRTEASAATFCAFFNTCLAEDIARLRERRRFALLSGTATIPRVNNPLNPSRGSIFQFQLSHASRLIGSDDLAEFTRGVAEAAWYRPLGRETVLSWRVKGGLIFATEIASGSLQGVYIPPDQRFYAGGANDVRGYQRNELGPIVYVVPEDTVTGQIDSANVRSVATGGNSLAVGNVEIRFPSPVFRERLRLAAFVDAGALWQRGTEGARPPLFRATPGVGLRVGTPLGPARLDVAYNPYSLPAGRLFVADAETGELVPQGEYDPPGRRGFTFHFAVGQPF